MGTYGRPDGTRDTRVYAGLRRRIIWEIRRYVECHLAYSAEDVRMYQSRYRTHQIDRQRAYSGEARSRATRQFWSNRIKLIRERLWLHLVWRPLAQLFDVDAPSDDWNNLGLPGERAIVRWLDSHPHLSHSMSGGSATGEWVEWFSIAPAPWSGRVEDWLLYTDDLGQQSVSGPLSSVAAQAEFMAFDAQFRSVHEAKMRRAYAQAGMEEDYEPLADQERDYDVFHAPFPVSSAYAHSPTADDWDDDWDGLADDYRLIDDIERYGD